MRLLAAAAIYALIFAPLPSLSRPDPSHAQVDPRIQQWFQDQIVPGGPGAGGKCCSIADGVFAQEDIRGDSYWVKFKTREGVEVDWRKVPDELVIKGPNINGSAVVWYRYDNGNPVIICFIPGGGV